MTDELEYGNDFIVLTDDDGQEFEVEHLDTIEFEGETYLAFLPANAGIEESYDLIIMKTEEAEDGEEYLVTLEDESELQTVFEIFKDRLEETFEEE